jgi:hypothetical protein
MSGVLNVIWHGLRDSLLMAWEVWWALVLGFATSAIVQAWVPRERVQATLGAAAGATARATLLGAAASSCSYAAVAIGRSLFAKGASAASSLAFQFASTNLVWELGLVLWVLIGWQFAAAEYVGGIVMIALMALLLRRFISPAAEREARWHAQAVEPGHEHSSPGSEHLGWRARLTSREAWTDVAQNFVGDWRMLYREIAVGFLLAGFIAQVPDGVFRAVFIVHAPAPLPAVENAVVGPLIAVASFVCSIGNVPLAAVLWSGGIGFAGVLAFLFADLIVVPILAIYSKYYGRGFALRILALMFVTMVAAALLVALIAHGLGVVPTGPRPSRNAVFGGLRVDYKLALNVVGAVIFTGLVVLSLRSRRPAPHCESGGDAHLQRSPA